MLDWVVRLGGVMVGTCERSGGYFGGLVSGWQWVLAGGCLGVDGLVGREWVMGVWQRRRVTWVSGW